MPARLTVLAICLIALNSCAATRKPVATLLPPPVAPADPPTVIGTQAVADLPDPQPVPPDAIPKREILKPPVVAETPAPRNPTRRPAAAAVNSATPPEPDPPVDAIQTVSPHPPLIPGDSSEASVDRIRKRITAVRALSARIAGKPSLPEATQMTNSRIKYFLDLAEKAMDRKDLRQADSLSGRAQVLAEDLLGVR